MAEEHGIGDDEAWAAALTAAKDAEPLVGTIGFGTEDFGRIALPAGTWNSEIIVKIPN